MATTPRDDEGPSSLKEQWLGLSRNTRIALIGAGSTILVLVVVIAVFFTFIVPQRRAEGSFAATAIAFTAAQNTLKGQISDAQTIARSVQPAQVKNKAVLGELASAINSANALIAATPVEASDTGAVRQQIADMNASIKAAQSAGTRLLDAMAAVQQSRVDLAYDNLKNAVASAQKVYDDSAGKVDDESLRTALQDQIDTAKQALASTGASSSAAPAQTPDQVIVTLNGLISSLTAAAQAVTNNEQKMANTPYTYLLTGAQISCGVALCSNSAVPSVKVTVSGTSVTADVCYSLLIDATNENSIETCTGMDGGSHWWTGWQGTRSGSSAVIQATGPNASPFFWATILFDSSTPDAPVIGFVSPDRCQRVDGSEGQNVGTGCA